MRRCLSLCKSCLGPSPKINIIQFYVSLESELRYMPPPDPPLLSSIILFPLLTVTEFNLNCTSSTLEAEWIIEVGKEQWTGYLLVLDNEILSKDVDELLIQICSVSEYEKPIVSVPIINSSEVLQHRDACQPQPQPVVLVWGHKAVFNAESVRCNSRG